MDNARNTRNDADFNRGASIGGGAPSTTQGGNPGGPNLNVDSTGGPMNSYPGNTDVFFDKEGSSILPKVATKP